MSIILNDLQFFNPIFEMLAFAFLYIYSKFFGCISTG